MSLIVILLNMIFFMKMLFFFSMNKRKMGFMLSSMWYVLFLINNDKIYLCSFVIMISWMILLDIFIKLHKLYFMVMKPTPMYKPMDFNKCYWMVFFSTMIIFGPLFFLFYWKNISYDSVLALVKCFRWFLPESVYWTLWTATCDFYYTSYMPTFFCIMLYMMLYKSLMQQIWYSYWVYHFDSDFVQFFFSLFTEIPDYYDDDFFL